MWTEFTVVLHVFHVLREMRLFAPLAGTCTYVALPCLFDLACFFLSSFSSLFKNMYILGLVFGVFGGFITPAFSFILS